MKVADRAQIAGDGAGGGGRGVGNEEAEVQRMAETSGRRPWRSGW